MPSQLHVWNGERAHVGRWRELNGIAVIAPIPGGGTLTAEFIEHCCDLLSEQGFDNVVTPALAPTELEPFIAAGFVVREQLFVLVHHLENIVDSTPGGITLRRARSGDLSRTLDVDQLAFDDFWRFDTTSLTEACSATPQSRFRVATTNAPLTTAGNRTIIPAGGVVGYCITGRSRYQGFLQRLAVAPEAQRIGIGSALVADALGWLHRRRARTCVVNTQESNAGAIALYRRCGFDESPNGLHVLARPLQSNSRQVV